MTENAVEQHVVKLSKRVPLVTYDKKKATSKNNDASGSEYEASEVEYPMGRGNEGIANQFYKQSGELFTDDEEEQIPTPLGPKDEPLLRIQDQALLQAQVDAAGIRAARFARTTPKSLKEPDTEDESDEDGGFVATGSSYLKIDSDVDESSNEAGDETEGNGQGSNKSKTYKEMKSFQKAKMAVPRRDGRDNRSELDPLASTEGGKIRGKKAKPSKAIVPVGGSPAEESKIAVLYFSSKGAHRVAEILKQTPKNADANLDVFPDEEIASNLGGELMCSPSSLKTSLGVMASSPASLFTPTGHESFSDLGPLFPGTPRYPFPDDLFGPYSNSSGSAIASNSQLMSQSSLNGQHNRHDGGDFAQMISPFGMDFDCPMSFGPAYPSEKLDGGDIFGPNPAFRPYGKSFANPTAVGSSHMFGGSSPFLGGPKLEKFEAPTSFMGFPQQNSTTQASTSFMGFPQQTSTTQAPMSFMGLPQQTSPAQASTSSMGFPQQTATTHSFTSSRRFPQQNSNNEALKSFLGLTQQTSPTCAASSKAPDNSSLVPGLSTSHHLGKVIGPIGEDDNFDAIFDSDVLEPTMWTMKDNSEQH